MGNRFFSYANITILSGEEELYPTFTITSDTTDEYKYEVNLSGIQTTSKP